ncbi:MAG: hypothetical protein AAGJ87_05740 [Pseudomonadota bacterium]
MSRKNKAAPEQREQGPHYIAELDPDNARSPSWSFTTELAVGVYLFVCFGAFGYGGATVGAWWMPLVAVLVSIIYLWGLRGAFREARAERLREQRAFDAKSDHGPHYIPELDPLHPASNQNDPGQRPLWRWFLISAAIILVGGVALAFGFTFGGISLIVLGFLMLAPFVLFIAG